MLGEDAVTVGATTGNSGGNNATTAMRSPPTSPNSALFAVSEAAGAAAAAQRKKQLKEAEDLSGVIAGFANESGKLLLCKSMLHAADLSGQTLPMSLASDWGRRVVREFSLQAKVEAEHALPPTVPVITNELEFYKSQTFFIGKIVAPLWRAIVVVMPELKERCDNMEANKRAYEIMIEDVEKV